MARSGWRYLATRLNGDGTETLIHPDLPIEDVSIDKVLSGINAISGKIVPGTPSLIGTDGRPLIRAWSTAIYAEADGSIRAGGIVTSPDPDGEILNIESVGFLGYSQDMAYTGSGYKGIEVDPIDCGRVIWSHIQSQPGGNIGLELDDTDTNGEVSIGTTVKQVEFDTQSGPVSFESGPWKLNWYTNHNLFGDFSSLASSTPFDFIEEHSWNDDGTIKHFVRIGYPKLGRRRTDVKFTWGVNVFDPVSMSNDGSLYASSIIVLGAGEGSSMIHAIREPVCHQPGDRLRRTAVVIDDSIKSRKRANARADQEWQWRRQLDDINSVVVRDHPDAPLGSVELGDEIRLLGRGDWSVLDMWVRVVSMNIDPTNGKVAEYGVVRTDKIAL